jgi:hypothetical protein
VRGRFVGWVHSPSGAHANYKKEKKRKEKKKKRGCACVIGLGPRDDKGRDSLIPNL